MQLDTILLTYLAPLPQKLAVAVSGGADSMALCYLLHDFCHRHNIHLTALTVNHGLRPEAQTEAEWVHHTLHASGISHAILSPHDPITTHQNLMAQARNLRYQLLTDYCHDHHIPYLAVAHHQEDQAETLLLRLARGSGVDGLAAMRPISTHYGITVLRPLLTTSKSSLLAYLKEHHLPWVEDPTNRNPHYARNRLRHALETYSINNNEIEDKSNLLSKRLANTATAMQRAHDALTYYTTLALEHCATLPSSDNKHATLNVAHWRTYPEEIRLRILETLMLAMQQTTKPIRFEKLQRLATRCLTEDTAKPFTLAGCHCTLHHQQLSLTPEHKHS